MAGARAKERMEEMKPSEIVAKIREKNDRGEWAVSFEAAQGLLYAFQAEEQEKEDAGQGQLF